MELRRIVIGSVAIFMVIVAAQDAHSEYLTGNELLKRCTSNDVAEVGNCYGYITAASDVMDWLDSASYYTGRKACVPVGVTASQLRDIITAYLRKNAADRQIAADVLAVAALAETYPCTEAPPNASSSNPFK